MGAEIRQLGLPKHVVETLLARPYEWKRDSKLFQKQLRKLVSKEEATQILSATSGDRFVFPLSRELSRELAKSVADGISSCSGDYVRLRHYRTVSILEFTILG